MKKNLLAILMLFVSIGTFAQTGTLRGIVYDDEAGEALMFSNYFIIETKSGGTTDLDGAFSEELAAGQYSVKFSFVGFAETTVKEIQVKAGEVTELNVRLKKDNAVLEEVVVKASLIKNTESALLTIQKKSATLMDGVSNQTFRKIGDSDAGGAIKRVTGVSVEGGKYVYVRGLGDRYTKTLLNGLDVPGLDPDRNSIQMDLFPTAIVDNIIIKKSFSPDLPGDFTGGLVDINTKDFPVAKVFNINVGTSINPAMNLNSNYLTYNGSSTDKFGFDNGLRDLPIAKDFKVPAPITGNSNLTDITKSFNPTMGVSTAKSPINFNLGISTGNQKNLKNVSLGYNSAFNYRNTTTYFEDVAFNAYRKTSTTSEDMFELEADRTLRGSLGKNNVLLSGLVGGAVKWKNHKVGLTLLHIQNGESTAGNFIQESLISNSNTLVRENLEYSQKSISNLYLSGKHNFKQGLYELNWGFSPTKSSINDKDVRVSIFRLDEGEYTIEPSEGAEPRRIWRNLNEMNYSGKIDLARNYSNKFGDNKIKIGFANTLKLRDYEIMGYRVNIKNQNQLDINGDANKLFLPENIWTEETRTGSYIVGNYEPANTYEASQNIAAAFILNEHQVAEKLKAVYGFRLEKFDHLYTGQNNSGSQVYDKEKFVSSFNVLPSLNLVYALNQTTNVRLAASRTLARPSFKEASIAQIYDALSDRTFIGNPDLKITNIENFDFRVENYGKSSQMLAASAFFKNFRNPIEVVAYSQATPNDIQPRNVGNAKIYGIELEARRDLGFISENLEPFDFGINTTFVKSTVKMSQSEFSSRVENARGNEEVSDTRQLQGQSPYIINTYFNYTGRSNGLQGNLSYNVQGKRLSVVGIGRNPDVYEVPFNSLNAKVSKSIKNFNVSVNASNLLNAVNKRQYESYNSEAKIFDLYKPGRTFGLSIGYKL